MADRRVARPSPGALQTDRPVLPSGALGVEGVLDRVLQELGHRHGERRCDVGRDLAEVPVHRNDDRL